MNFKFVKDDRVVRQIEFDRVYQSGFVAADDVLVVKAACNSMTRTRLGLSVSRRVGNAVVRNQWKRVIREAFRTARSDLPLGLDIVVRPRKGADVDFHRVKKSLVDCCKRIKRKIDRTQ